MPNLDIAFVIPARFSSSPEPPHYEESIRAWMAHLEHRAAQTRGKQIWYAHYEVRVARVERAYNMLPSVPSFIQSQNP